MEGYERHLVTEEKMCYILEEMEASEPKKPPDEPLVAQIDQAPAQMRLGTLLGIITEETSNCMLQ